MGEIWRSVIGYEGVYEVSDIGRVRSVPREARNGVGTRQVRGQVLSLYTRADGRMSVDLSVENRQSTVLVHHLVLEAFIGPRPVGTECCHGDGDPANNMLTNLRWDSHVSNVADTIRHGRHVNGNKLTCLRGHPLVMPNLKPAQLEKGRRSCLACSREYASARSQRRPFDHSKADERFRSLAA